MVKDNQFKLQIIKIFNSDKIKYIDYQIFLHSQIVNKRYNLSYKKIHLNI